MIVIVVERVTESSLIARKRTMGGVVWKWMTTTDHKVIGNLYFITSMGFFMFGGVLGPRHPRRAGQSGTAVYLI